MNSRNRKSRNKSFSRNAGVDYQQLEVRNLLTVDVGLNLNTSMLDLSDPFPTADVNGDIGPNHIVEVISGNYSVRLADGTEVQSSSLDFFWQAAGADLTVDTDMMGNPILGETQDPRVVYDHDSGRWYISSIVADEDGENLPGNQILLAVSRTDNPIDGFQSVQFVGDTTGDHFNSFATLAVDGDGVFIGTNNELTPLNTSVSIYAIPKADLTGTIPSALNLERFENLDENVFGNTIQFATDLDGNTDTSYGLGTFEDGITVSLVGVSNLGTGAMVTMSQFDVTVPFYEAAEGGRQPNDVTRLNNISPDIVGNVVAQGGYLWTAHAVDGSADNSAIRWYQIDEVTKNVVNTGDIEDPNIDFLYPSISVNQYGGIAIGFTGTGLGVAPSTFLTLGFTAYGLDDIPTVTFPQEPALIQEGVGNYVRLVDGVNVFGEYSATRVDPDNPFSFFSFQNYHPGDDLWGVNIGQARITDIAPVVNADDNDNEVVLRRSPTDGTLAEVVIDGVVTDIFEMSALDSIELNLLDGDDTITIDNSLGSFVTDLGFAFNGGDGTDTVVIVDSVGHRFDITGDGSGLFDEVSTFSGMEIIIGSDGDDVFTSSDSTTDWMISGGPGDDIFDIGNSATGSYVLAGESGDDTYRIPLANFGSIEVIDSIDAENDALVGLGTDGDDVLLVNNELLVFNGLDVSIFGFDGIERLDFDGIGGNDTFNIQAFEDDVSFFGSDGNDEFNVASDAPLNSGVSTAILGELSIDGGDGFNRLVVSNQGGIPVDALVTTDQITGFTLMPINYAGNFGMDNGMQGLELIGSDFGPDLFEIRGLLSGNSLLARGGIGNDTFTVRGTTSGETYIDGGFGADTIRTSYGENTRVVNVIDSGEDDFRLDRFSVRLSDDDDIFEIANDGLNIGNNSFGWDANLGKLIVDTLAGNDSSTVQSNNVQSVRVILNDGDDVGIVEDNQGIRYLRFDGNDGEDSFQFLGSVADTSVQARGGADNDSLFVGEESFARTRVDGEDGNDNVEIVFARRDSRRVNARDTGDGFDSLVVTGTPAADRIALRPQNVDREGEVITYNMNTEQFDMNLLGSADVLNVYGSSALQFVAGMGIGNDFVNVHRTSTPNESLAMDFVLGAGNDTANFFRISQEAEIRAFGQVGDDNFNVGSTTVADNGNLSKIRGDLFLSGGADFPGFDSLRVNDRGAGLLNFAYTVTDTSISHASGPFGLSRPFDSFNYNDMEFVLLAGTDGTNLFNVRTSATTLIRIDGNLNPLPDDLFGDSLNVLGDPISQGRQLFMEGNAGFFTFTDGSRNISFEEIERIVEGSSSENFGVGMDFGEDDDFLVDALLDAIDLPLD